MPKFTYSAAKGIEQSSGSGFQVNDVAILEEIQALTDPAGVTIEPYGITTLALTTGTPSGTLAAPTSSEPAGVRKVITCVSRSGGACTITLTGNGVKLAGTADLASLLFNAAGETAVLVSNGTKWVHVAGAGVTEG